MKWPSMKSSWVKCLFTVSFMTALCMSAGAGAKTFTVNAGLDAINQPVPDGEEVVCDIGTGMNECSLRAAIQAANSNPGPDIIEIELATLGLMAGLVNENGGFSGDLDIRCSEIAECENESLTITGGMLAGDDVTIIEAAGLFDRAFHIVDPIEVTFRNLEVRNTNAGNSSGDGTAIWNLGTLTLDNVTVTGSTGRIFVSNTGVPVVTSADGAILNSGVMTLRDVRVLDNLGDGIHAGSGRIEIAGLTSTGNSVAGLKTISEEAFVEVIGGDLTLSRNAVGFWSTGGRAILKSVSDADACEISENDIAASDRLNPSHGVLLVGGFTTIERCNISDNVNEPFTGGSGISNLGTLELVDSRVLRNDEGLRNLGRAIVRGSAIFDHNFSGIENFGTLTVVNTTVSGNAGAGISSQDLGTNNIAALRLYSSTVVSNAVADLRQSATANLIDVRNSIVAVCQGPLTTASVIRSLGFNIGMDASCGFDVTPGDQVIADLIGGTIDAQLALNDGMTESHRLLADTAGSTDVSCPITDQRGKPRTLGSCDVGAYQISGTAQTPVVANGTIFVASDAASAVFAIPADYDQDMDMNRFPPVLTRGSGLVGPISVTGNGTDFLVLDAEQGLVFQIDLATGIPRVFSSTGLLTSPRDLEYGPDGDVFVVGQPGLPGGVSVVRIDPVTRGATTVVHSPQLSNLQSIDFDANGDLIVSSRNLGVFRIVLLEDGVGVASQIASVSDPSGLAVRRTGELLVVNRATNDVVDLDPAAAGNGTPIGIAGIEPMVLASPRGLGIELETGIQDSLVQVTMIVSERNGKLHRIVWNGTTPMDTDPILAEIPQGLIGPSSLFGLWVLRDQDEDGILDVDDDTDGDGLSDDFETNSGIFIDAAHPGTDPNDKDSDDDNLLDGFEVANGFDPHGEGCDPGAPGLPGCESTLDPDEDGLTNLEEQMAGTDPHDKDSDDDNLLDGFEVANGFDPLSAGENCNPGNPGRPGCDDTLDPDEDGSSNFQEQMAGTDPNDSDDFLFARVPAVGRLGIWVLAPLLLLASRFLLSRRQAAGLIATGR